MSSPTPRAVRAIDNQIRLIDEQLYERAQDEKGEPPHVREQRERARRAIGAPTSAELVEQRMALEDEREFLLEDRRDYASEDPDDDWRDHGRPSLDEQLDAAEMRLDMEDA